MQQNKLIFLVIHIKCNRATNTVLLQTQLCQDITQNQQNTNGHKEVKLHKKAAGLTLKKPKAQEWK